MLKAFGVDPQHDKQDKKNIPQPPQKDLKAFLRQR
jgi:hypothetical protein